MTKNLRTHLMLTVVKSGLNQKYFARRTIVLTAETGVRKQAAANKRTFCWLQLAPRKSRLSSHGMHQDCVQSAIAVCGQLEQG